MRTTLWDVLACALIAAVPLLVLWSLAGEILKLLGRLALTLSGVP